MKTRKTRAEWVALLARLMLAHATEQDPAHRTWLAGQVRVVRRKMAKRGWIAR